MGNIKYDIKKAKKNLFSLGFHIFFMMQLKWGKSCYKYLSLEFWTISGKSNDILEGWGNLLPQFHFSSASILKSGKIQIYISEHFVTKKCKFGFHVGNFGAKFRPNLGWKIAKNSSFRVFTWVIYIKNHIIGVYMMFFILLIHLKLKKWWIKSLLIGILTSHLEACKFYLNEQ